MDRLILGPFNLYGKMGSRVPSRSEMSPLVWILRDQM